MNTLMILALSLYASIAIHECGHFLVFRMNKIPMRMLNITFFSFIFDGSKWNFVFNRNTGGVGGIAIPNLGGVQNEEAFRKVRKAYARAILGGPLMSLILLVMGMALLAFRDYLFVTGVSFIIVNGLTLLSCFIKADGVYGDFPAYKAFEKDDFFAAIMIYQYGMFSVDYKKVRKNNAYLRHIILEGLEPRVFNKQTDLLTVSAVSTFLVEYLVGVTDQVPEWLKEYVDYYYENYRVILETHKSEASKELLLRISYYYKKEGLEDRAMDIYENFIQRLGKSEVFDYWKIQSDQLIMGEDREAYLLDKNNIKPGLAYGVFKKLAGFYHDELTLNQLRT